MEHKSLSASLKQKTKPQREVSFKKRMLYRVFFLLGILALIFLINAFTGYLTSSAAQDAQSVVSDPNPQATVTCDGQPMTQDQACDHQIVTVNDQTLPAGSFTYEEQKQYQQDQRIQDAKDAQANKWAIIVWPLGILSLLLACVVIIIVLSFPISIRRQLNKRREAKRQSQG